MSEVTLVARAASVTAPVAQEATIALKPWGLRISIQ